MPGSTWHYVMNTILNIEKSYDTWTWQRISRHILYWTAWTVFYMTVNANYNDGNYANWLFVELYILPVKWIFAYFVIYVLMPKYFFMKKYVLFFFAIIPTAIVCGFMMRYIDVTYVYPKYFDLTGKALDLFSFKVIYKTLDLVYIGSLVAIIKLIQHNKKQEQIQQNLMQERLSAELQLLKNQLHPHFLFNTLNNLYGMILTQEKGAADVVIRLSNMMSYMLYECDVSKIALTKEIAYLRNYIELEKIRYKERLDISFEVAGEVDDKQIAPLILIPFIENAFKHGAAKDDKQTWININIWVEDDILSFKIENSLPNEIEELTSKTANMQSGIGLQNVRKRLELLYSEKHELTIIKENSFLVKLNLVIDK